MPNIFNLPIHKKRLLIILVLAISIASCRQTKEEDSGTHPEEASSKQGKEEDSSNSNRSEQPHFVELAENQWLFSRLHRSDFKSALSSFIQTKYPGSTINGFAEETYAGNMYLLAVDLSLPRGNKIVHVIARIFMIGDDKTYWRMEEPTNDLLRRMKLIKQSEDKPKDKDNE
jgi:hypothetical protein